MLLSIVITTYNRASVLEQLLRSLEQQSDLGFQVVVAIDGSTDGTEEMLEKFKTAYSLKWVNTHCTGYGLAVARNMGILAADGEAVVVLDDDSFPDPGFVAAHKQSVRLRTITGGPRNPAVSSDVRMIWKMRELARLPLKTPIKLDQLRAYWPHAYLIENNICLYRQDWIDVGLFSERLKMYGFIGQEFFGRAEYFGYAYQFNPDASVIHHGQLEGDNGFGRSKKKWQTMIAKLLRPSLMTAKHYLAQMQWAKSQAAPGLKAFRLPSFRLRAFLALPFRFVVLVLGLTKSQLRRLVR